MAAFRGEAEAGDQEVTGPSLTQNGPPHQSLTCYACLGDPLSSLTRRTLRTKRQPHVRQDAIRHGLYAE